ncbi:PREDICTED: uncharacterized protein LOC104824839 [Tarenaya hassleriana]|uniref:uncharacterized protein LOC104824839 n=1 Tax=Tarenaya hassleriana TaxID=28532 RepID=UPI00053C7C8D|nr:PREDICTED: uncharacterized protein LOC104824839 [Tarenaya hassleriana]
MALLSLSSFSLFAFASVLLISFAVPVVSEPRAFEVGIIQKVEEKCPYTVIVKTSCVSPDSTRDHISLAFGDDDGNQVYAPRLDEGETFDKCSTKTFQIKGQCLNEICFAYIYRTGPDGWVPENVEIYSEDEKAVRFDFDRTSVPENTWFGKNQCNNTRPQPPPYFPPHTPSPPPLFPPEPPLFPPPPPSRPSAASGLRAGELLVLGLVGVVAVMVF